MLRATMPALHDKMRGYRCIITAALFGAASRSVSLAVLKSTREAIVDLAVKLNALAVFAVFAFVGAILLGAF
jgi:hypothetical protein